MKRLTLEATDENILNSIKENTFGRGADVREFVETLDSIEGNMFISLDARWGEGKTFYVRQIEKTLEYLTKRDWEEELGILDELKPYFENTPLNSIQLQRSYLPIYYNSWLYDNHDDPLMSLVLTIVKKSEQYLKTTLDDSVKEKVGGLLSAISMGVTCGRVQFSYAGEGANRIFEGKDILATVKTVEEIREQVKRILNAVIVEKAERLVIFVDELDRCRPNYAIEMLERIKHYFDDERILFILSVNKEQLVHTISKHYGYGFDSTAYLNKFFDLNAHMPAIEPNFVGRLVVSNDARQFHAREIVAGLNNYYKLSIRDSLIYKQRLSKLPRNWVNDHTEEGCCMSLFIPIIVILDMKDQNEKIKFLSGNSNVIEKLTREVGAVNKLIKRFTNSSEEIETGLRRMMATYEFVFKEQGAEYGNEDILVTSIGLKRMCIKICNGFDV